MQLFDLEVLEHLCKALVHLMLEAFYSISTLSFLYWQDSLLDGKPNWNISYVIFLLLIPLFAKNPSLSPSNPLILSLFLFLCLLLCVHKSTQVIPQFCNAELLFSACKVLNYIANLFLGNRLDNNIKICFWPKYFDVYYMLPKVIWNHWLHATNTQIQYDKYRVKRGLP